MKRVNGIAKNNYEVDDNNKDPLTNDTETTLSGRESVVVFLSSGL